MGVLKTMTEADRILRRKAPPASAGAPIALVEFFTTGPIADLDGFFPEKIDFDR